MKLKSYFQYIKENVSTDMAEINAITDYTLLDESASGQDILRLCRKAKELNVKSVCVLPKMVKIAAQELKDSNILVCTVISFPSGLKSADEKADETSRAIYDGADEIDMVLNHSIIKQKGYKSHDELWGEVQKVAEVCHTHRDKKLKNITLKVIVESGLLTDEEVVIATEICEDGGADYIKTSTGKIVPGAELNKVKIMYHTIKNNGSKLRIKASGGINDMAQIDQLLPYVDRFGMGCATVDKLNGASVTNTSNY